MPRAPLLQKNIPNEEAWKPSFASKLDAAGEGGSPGPRLRVRRAYASRLPLAAAPRGIGQPLDGSFSAVSKSNFASKYALESSRRDLHNALLYTALQSQFFVNILPKLSNFRESIPDVNNTRRTKRRTHRTNRSIHHRFLWWTDQRPNRRLPHICKCH